MRKGNKTVILLVLAMVLVVSAAAVGLYYASGIPQELRSLRLHRTTGRPIEDVPLTYPKIKLFINGEEYSGMIAARPDCWRGVKTTSSPSGWGIPFGYFTNRPAVGAGDVMTAVFTHYPPDSVSVRISDEPLTDNSNSSSLNPSREIPCEYDADTGTITFSVTPEHEKSIIYLSCVWDVRADRDDQVLYYFALDKFSS